MLLSRNKIIASLHFLPDSSLVYVNNAKVACTSIKKSLWLWYDHAHRVETFSGSPHDRAEAPFVRTFEALARQRETLSHATTFTVVRNPYARILSAYLDKIAREKRDIRVWRPFAYRFGLKASAVPSFLEFLQLIETEDISCLDQHFAPQTVNVLYGLIPMGFIGFLERMDRVEQFLDQRGIGLATHLAHKTGASDLVSEAFGPAERAIVEHLYRDDFEVFGYQKDPKHLAPEKDRLEPGGVGHLSALLQVFDQTRPRPDRLRALSELTFAVPAIDRLFLELEAGLLTRAETLNAYRRMIDTETRNWRVLSRLAQELLRMELPREAARTLARLEAVMDEHLDVT